MSDITPPIGPKILNGERFEIDLEGPEHVRKKLLALERTEDCRFSPDGRRLAIAGFARNSIAIFDVEITASEGTQKIVLSDYIELKSAELEYPHGVDFVDNSTLVVANRERLVSVFNLPTGQSGQEFQADPLVRVTRADRFNKLSSPGSVSVTQLSSDSYEVMVCNNYTHRVTRHTISRSTPQKVTQNRIALDKGLNVPDGIAISNDRDVIAVSNHFKHEVYLYPNDGKNRRATLPTGVLKWLDFPHGLRFFGQDKYIFVADAGLPFARVYKSEDGKWRGDHAPVMTIRMMDDELFLKGHYYHQEGGLKGLDFSPCQRILATTCEMQPLAFYDATRMFAHI